MKGHKGHHHRAKGGRVRNGEGGVAPGAPRINQYNAHGAPEAREAHEGGSGFRRGGKVGGHKGKSRLDRKPRARGGRCMASGGSVLSAASKTSPAKAGKSGGGTDKEDD